MPRISTALFAVFFSLLATHAFARDVVHIVRINGVINSGTARHIIRGIETAEKEESKLLLVTLNTPGGLLQATREIVQKMNSAKVPVAVYVFPSGGSATSAGTIITMAAHVAGMAPGTNIGAAHPVGGQGEDIKGAMNDKAVNDTVAFIKAQAALHNRNQEWAEQAIRKSVSVTADEAQQKKIVDFIAKDEFEAILKVDGQLFKNEKIKVAGLPIEELQMTLGEKLLTFLGHPNVSYLLMGAGGLGLYAEFSSPGLSIPGVLGLICLILGFISMYTLSVNAGAAALLVLGLVLFILELFVTSYGALTVGGIISLVLGAIFLMDPSTGDLRLSLGLVIPTVLAIGVISGVISYLLVKSRKTSYHGFDDFSEYEGVVNVIDESGRLGKCTVRGEVWDFEVESQDEPVSMGQHLQIIKRENFKLRVRRKHV